MTAIIPPRGTLPENEMKQQMSIAYIRAVTAAAGLEISRLDSDYNGVDLTVRSFAEYEQCKNSSLDIQLKCTSQDEIVGAAHVAWQLEGKTYREYTHPKRYELGILAVLVVPNDYRLWLDQDENRLLSAGCMYFSPANEWPPIAENQETKVVHCGRTNILDVDRLLGLMHASAKFKMAVH